jgi:hypothetical protein
MHVKGSIFEQDIKTGTFKKLPALSKSYLLRAGGQAVILFTDQMNMT